LTYISKERLFAALMSCKYVLQNNIDGDFVECGVWKGGNSIIAAGIFNMYNSCKKVYLYDTFQGMTAPTDVDVSLREDGILAREILNAAELDKNKKWTKNIWCHASTDDVETNFSNLGLLSENVKFVQGDILQTLDVTIPDKISVLRLDTDWYESTKKEMDVLYERIDPNGVLMVDDYGHWAASKKAVDEYFSKNNNRPFIQYIDYTGRLGIKSV